MNTFASARSAAPQSRANVIARLRSDVEERKAAIKTDRIEARAERAEIDAEVAVAFAIAAIQQAEYAVLDATLARAEANTAADLGPV